MYDPLPLTDAQDRRPRPQVFLLALILVLPAVAGVWLAVRAVQAQERYETAALLHRQGNCAQAVAEFDRLLANRKLYDISPWHEAAAGRRAECLIYLAALSQIEQLEFGPALLTFHQLVEESPDTELRQHIDAQLGTLYSLFGPASVIDDGVCTSLSELIVSNLIPDHHGLRPLFHITCGQFYDGYGRYADAVPYYLSVMRHWSEHELAYEAEFALLNSPISCEHTVGYQADAAIATRKDFMPLLYWSCAEMHWDNGRFSEAEAAYSSIQQHYPGHVLAAQVPAALAELRAQLDSLATSVDATVRARNEKILLSVGIGFVPGIGDLKDVLDFLAGKDLITGDTLTREERALILVATVFSAGSALRYSDELTAMARYSDELASIRHTSNLTPLPKYCDEMGAWYARNRDELYDLAKYSDELAAFLARSGDDVAYLARHSDELVSLTARASGQAPEVLRHVRLVYDCSFVPTTLVSTEEGLLPIARLQPGMRVYAYHEREEQVALYNVQAVHSHFDENLIALGLERGEVITTTRDHPFYVEGTGWVSADKLAPGTLVRTQGQGPHAIRWLRAVSGGQAMINLTIAEAHTFFVGTNRILVHNRCSSTRLNRNLRGVSDDGLDAHHLIPAEFETHDAVKYARGYDMDASYNGVLLPESTDAASAYYRRHGRRLPAHVNNHPDYSSRVGAELDRLWAERGNMSRRQMREALMELAGRLRRSILRSRQSTLSQEPTFRPRLIAPVRV